MRGHFCICDVCKTSKVETLGGGVFNAPLEAEDYWRKISLASLTGSAEPMLDVCPECLKDPVKVFAKFDIPEAPKGRKK